MLIILFSKTNDKCGMISASCRHNQVTLSFKDVGLSAFVCKCMQGLDLNSYQIICCVKTFQSSYIVELL